MKPASTITQLPLAVLLVGEPKTGKSSVMLGFPDLAVIDWDLNLGSAMRRAKGLPFDVFQPAVAETDVKLPNGVTVPAGHKIPDDFQWWYFSQELPKILSNPKYKTIALDGLGEMTRILTEHIVHETKSSGSNKTGKMELQNWGDYNRLLRMTIMGIRASGKYLVTTSHQTSDKDDTTGIIRFFVAISGQSKDTIGGWHTDVWATTKRPKGMSDEIYELRVKADARSVPLGASFEFPSNGALDITNKSPSDIWKTIEPKILAK